MHRCVCIWWYILQNYNYKLHFQNLSLYTTFHMYPPGPWPLKILMFALLVTCDQWDSNIQLTMGKDRRQLLPSHLDLHLEVFIPKKKKEIVENITAGSGNLKTKNLRTFGSGVSPNPHQRTSGFHERPRSFPGSYLTCLKQRDHPRPYTHRLFDHHGYISKPDICFLDNHGYQRDARRGFGLISDTRPTLVTTYWKRRFTVLASPPSLGSIGPVNKWNWAGCKYKLIPKLQGSVSWPFALLCILVLANGC